MIDPTVITLPSVQPLFPAGTVLKVYADAVADSGSLKPLGPVISEGTVQDDGTVTFEELVEDTQYYAGVQVEGVWRLLLFHTLTGEEAEAGGITKAELVEYLAPYAFLKDLPVLNVQSSLYGAKGDGVTNDTIAISAALADATGLGGAVVYLPPGLYLAEDTLVIENDVTLCGAGWTSSRIKLADEIEKTLLTTARFMEGDEAAGAECFSLRNIAFDGNKEANPGMTDPLVDIDGLGYIIENVLVRHGAAYGMRSDMSRDPDPGEKMEALVHNLFLQDSDEGSLDWQGPHDSILGRVIARAGCTGTNVIATGISNWMDLHCYGNAKYGVDAISGQFINCQSEGNREGCVRILGDGVKWIGGRVFSAGGEDGLIGFIFGDEAEEFSANSAQIKDVEIANCDNGAFVFLYPGYGSQITGFVYGAEGAAAIVGAPVDVNFEGLIVRPPMVYGDSHAQFQNDVAGCSVVLTADQTIPSTFTTPVDWDTDAGERCYNDNGCWSAEDPSQFVAPVEGLYRLDVSLYYTDEPAEPDTRLCMFIVDGNDIQGVAVDGSNIGFHSLSAQFYLEEGHIVQVMVRQESGGDADLGADKYGVGPLGKVGRATFELIRPV